jgi:exosortase D (VPLPA-CTERM-specific)
MGRAYETLNAIWPVVPAMWMWSSAMRSKAVWTKENAIMTLESTPIDQGRIAADQQAPVFVRIGVVIALFAAAGLYFQEGLGALLEAWALPEYSHGPLIPLLSSLLFLRELRRVPVERGAIDDRWPGVLVIALSLALGFLGKIVGIADVVAYAMIVFVAGVILVTFGFRRGVHFWPAVLHLAFMLPLPGLVYWKISTNLQLFSSEVGVWMIRAAGIPVHLDGNIIDLGIYKLHVAEACSGLRYLYPIMSFSYIFAALYKGPVWHKAILLLSAAPITVMMNSVRIGIIGIIVDSFGLAHVEGITHLLEGWVIFLTSVVILFGLVKLMLWFHPVRMTLSESLDIDFDGLGAQAARATHVRLSPAMIATVAVTFGAAALWSLAPERREPEIARDPLALFPSAVEEWRRVSTSTLEPSIERALGADDYLSASFRKEGMAAPIEFFTAWYADQSTGGIHSPEVCLPGGGWEMAEIQRIDLAPRLGASDPFMINRAIIQKGQSRLLVYYWFEQYGGRTASDFAAKLALLKYGLIHNRTDGALVRMITPMLPGETADAAEARLFDFTSEVMPILDEYIPRHS